MAKKIKIILFLILISFEVAGLILLFTGIFGEFNITKVVLGGALIVAGPIAFFTGLSEFRE